MPRGLIRTVERSSIGHELTRLLHRLVSAYFSRLHGEVTLVAEKNRGTAGQPKATVYRGIRVVTPNATLIWIAAATYRDLYNLKNPKIRRC